MMSFKTRGSISNKSSLLIEELLKQLSQKKNIRILFAVAWGSRAYGLESPKSDYDVRFVFAQEKKGESLNEDTITDNGLKIDNYLIDYSGWDITKAINGIYKMNPSIIEWIFSPIVYKDDGYFLHTAKQLVCSQRRILPLLDHYKSMGEAQFNENIDGKKLVLVKEYMSCVRCRLMVEWLLTKYPEPWTRIRMKNFLQLNVNQVIADLKTKLNQQQLNSITILIKKKKSGDKESQCNPDPIIDAFIKEMFDIDLKDYLCYQTLSAYNKLVSRYI